MSANKLFTLLFLFLVPFQLYPQTGRAQSETRLNHGWKCRNILSVNATGEEVSKSGFETGDWLPATVPGTVLTTLLNNELIPDPFYGMNNELIPDIYDTGIEHYTYWFINDFEETYPAGQGQVWLHFRGVNYSCDIFLNGEKVNQTRHRGMFLRQTYNITRLLSREGNNRLAVIVYPPDPPGNPNGGQGGDGVIGKNVTHQYVAGWDWIQPVRDRNTGIWDEVIIERTGLIDIKNPHIITLVPGQRNPEDEISEPAVIRVSAELINSSIEDISGTLQYRIGDELNTLEVLVPADSNFTVLFPDLEFRDPDLWWPNGYGPPNLYTMEMEFITRDDKISDAEEVTFGIREISTGWNAFTRSRQIYVNGQPIFIKGGNWIISDAMLRFSEERYDAEIRFHRDMNLNLIRIWGGAITERPAFYNSCDKYGILVWQDFWMTGDCNGRWQDPRKKDDQWVRKKYPDDHDLFVVSVIDQVKMIRNHPSLAIWCGGNEIGPPEDIVKIMKDTLKSGLDGTRLFIESSTSGEMYFNSRGGTGDGPYGIQETEVFWEEKSFPFNPELGSVGTGDLASLKRFIPDSSLIVPGHYEPQDEENSRWARIEPVWRYHKYLPYGNFIERYGEARDVREFSNIAQLINYDQYRAMAEGFSSHMWEWYTGFIIWKTQNPWTALRGQMYDWYLDPNAGLYGLHHGSEPLHIMYNPVTHMIMVVNNSFKYYRDVMVIADSYDQDGKSTRLYQQMADIEPVSIKNCQSIGRGLISQRAGKGAFLSLKLLKSKDEALSENLYWLPDSTGNYPFLHELPATTVDAEARKLEKGKIELKLSNHAEKPMAFFIRLSLVDGETHERLLPVFYSDNYISLEPAAENTVILDYPSDKDRDNLKIMMEGWNVDEMIVEID
ncbi:MAG: glycosyl hydrolase [Cyclobacteriaceae bacterium]|nr:glycosyl hydrolase [Cyclobacteriaceae bacterium]